MFGDYVVPLIFVACTKSVYERVEVWRSTVRRLGEPLPEHSCELTGEFLVGLRERLMPVDVE